MCNSRRSSYVEVAVGYVIMHQAHINIVKLPYILRAYNPKCFVLLCYRLLDIWEWRNADFLAKSCFYDGNDFDFSALSFAGVGLFIKTGVGFSCFNSINLPILVA